MQRSSAATTVTDPTPTPPPASEQRSTSTRRPALEDIPPHLRQSPLLRYMVEMTAEEAAEYDALVEASALYGEDDRREREDIEAGRHPLQRLKTG